MFDKKRRIKRLLGLVEPEPIVASFEASTCDCCGARYALSPRYAQSTDF